MKPYAPAIAAIALMLPAPALAQAQRSTFEDGNTFLAQCDGSMKPECLGYVIGYSRAVDALGIFEGKKYYCTPQQVTNGQVHDVVVAYIRNRPQDRHVPLAALTFVALRQAFPCVGTGK